MIRLTRIKKFLKNRFIDSKLTNRASLTLVIEEIRNAEIRHNTKCETEDMEKIVKDFLGI